MDAVDPFLSFGLLHLHNLMDTLSGETATKILLSEVD